MTNEHYILVDLVLKKMPLGEPFTLQGLYQHILDGEEENYPNDTLIKVGQIASSGDRKIPSFLLKHKYIKLTHNGKIISDEAGEKAQELGGHKEYDQWVQRQKKQNWLIEFPKKYWYIVAIGGFLLGKGWDRFIEDKKSNQIENPKQDTIQLQQQVQALQDSVQSLLRQPKETLYIRQIRSASDSILSDTTK